MFQGDVDDGDVRPGFFKNGQRPGQVFGLAADFQVAVLDGVAAATTLAVRHFALRSGDDRWLSIGGHVVLAATALTLTWIALLSGQEQSMSTWYLTGLPLFAGYHMGTRAAVAWTAIAVALMALVNITALVVRFEPIYLPDGNTLLMGKLVLLFVILGFSIATRRGMDHYVDILNEREAVIRERARELSSARDEALEAVSAKNQFLANMSHEIRTPLNGIIGMTSVMLDNDQSSEQREIIKTIQRSSNTLLAVINEILDFSRLEAGARLPEAIPFDVRECVEDVVDMFARDARVKRLDIAFLPRRNTPRWIEGDITYLRQVLINLVGNAVKFTDAGEVVVEVKPGSKPGELHFCVSDTGIGIPQEKQSLLFRSFSQVDNSTTRKYGGSGLGLAISKRLIELMGGDIWVESEPEAGTRFHFTIMAPEAQSPDRPLTTQDRVNLIGKTARILHARPASRDALEELLKLIGIKAQVDEGEVADIIFTFGEIPDESERDDGAPVVAIVPVTDQAALDRAQQKGATVVFWPPRRRALRRTLDALATGTVVETPASLGILDPSMATRIPARILVAEDNPINQKVAVTVLERLGYSPDVVSSGLEVVEAVKRRSYDILFMDLHMPGLDGVGAATRIRDELPPDRQPWIVALTASMGVISREGAEMVGMNDYLGKPFDVQTLMVAIERYDAERRSEVVRARDRLATVETAWDQLRSLFAARPEKLADLVDEHIANGRRLRRDIRVQCANGDIEQVRRSAHSLKSSSAQFGSDEVAELSRQLEKVPFDCPSEEIDDLLCRLLASWEQAEQRLTASAAGLRRAATPL